MIRTTDSLTVSNSVLNFLQTLRLFSHPERMAVVVVNGSESEQEKQMDYPLVAKSKEEFGKRRKILITSLPDAVDLEVSKSTTVL